MTAITGDGSLTASEGQRSLTAQVWSLFLSLLLLMVGNALQGAIVGVRTEAEGFSLIESGIVMASYFAGFLIGARMALTLIANVGHIRVFAALASTASAMVLAHLLLVSAPTWAAMRFVFGACMATIYVVVESWLNDMATNETRGRLLSVYMVINGVAFACGQFMLNLADTNGFQLFVLASVLVSLSLVPMALSPTSAPPMSRPAKMTLRELWDIVPTGLVTSFFVGVAAGALIGIAPVYAAAKDLSTGRISLFLAAPMMGAVISQWPIGWLSDRVSRRAVILAVSIAAAAAASGPVLTDGREELLPGFMFLLGSLIYPLYSLSISYTNDWLTHDRVVGASGVLIRINGTGAILGPLVATVLMTVFAPEMMFWTIGGALTVIVGFVIHRIIVVEALPAEQQRKFIPLPARSSAFAARLIPRRRRRRGLDLRPRRRFDNDDGDSEHDGDSGDDG